MKTIIACIVLATILLACGGTPPATPGPTAPAAPTPTQPAQPTVTVRPATPAPAVTPTPAPDSAPAALSADGKKLQEQFRVADGRLKSYRYFYSDRRAGNPVKFPIWGNFKVKGDRIRIDITPVEEMSARLANLADSDRSMYQPQLYGDDYYDQFFLNTATEEGVARCDNPLCRKRAGIAPVSFKDFYRKTPMDWRKEIPLDQVRIIDNKQIQGQSITRITYTADGEPMVQYLEGYSMLPTRVDIGDPEDDGYTIHFTDFAPNSVGDKEFEGVSI